MSTFGSLKTLKLERTLGDSVLSISTHVSIDADEVKAFGALDTSIIESASNLKDFNGGPTIKPEVIKAEVKEIVKEVVKEEKPRKNKKGAGRPKGSTKKKQEEVKEVKEETKKVANKIETLADQDEKVALIGFFQESFEENVGFESEDTYMDEFNTFLSSLISMDYKTFLEADVTVSQIKTFKELI